MWRIPQNLRNMLTCFRFCKHSIMTICTTKCKLISLSVVIVILLAIGICAVSLCKTVYHHILLKELTISNHSTGYELWKETPIPMYLNVYMFNWTNADEVLKNWTTKPIFQECGPYVFSEHHIRVNLTWNETENTVTYYQKRIWQFQSDLSTGTLQDNITNLNVIAAVNSCVFDLKEKHLVQTRTVSQWTFEGYEDKLLQLLVKLNISNFNIPESKFGWFYGRNNSEVYDGNFTMYTGVDNIDLLGIINKWNSVSWTGDYTSYCGVVNGTSGELWPPVKKYDKVAIFSPDLCSTIWLSHQTNYSEEIVGMTGKKYIGTDFLFDNGTKYPEQKCFVNDKSFPSGVRDVSACKFGAPAFVSFPHFYLADNYYTDPIVEVRASVQLNLLIEPMRNIHMFKNVKETFVPMLWFSQTTELTETLGRKTKMLLTVPSILTYSGCGLIGIACLLIFVTVYYAYNKVWISHEEERLLSEDT
ncbi:CD36 family [Popillia japonica]|uniref:CD36 family n=1 Tax=Popillia japonica TaxID=7064 RepID=A0AAW1IA11_POPJA